MADTSILVAAGVFALLGVILFLGLQLRWARQRNRNQARIISQLHDYPRKKQLHRVYYRKYKSGSVDIMMEWK